MATVNVEVSYSGGTDVSQLFVDDRHVLTGPGSGSIKVNAGEEDHALTWFVRGQPGSTYELKITAPKPAVFTYSATIDGSTKDGGLYWFRVGSGGDK